MPKLSIITINLNNKSGLQKTMESVFAQTFTDYEYIIIDGGSADGSKEWIEKHQNKFVYQVSEKDKGIYHAMNKGILKASGEYLLFLNSGDYLVAETVLESMLEQGTESVDLLFGNLERTFPDGRTDVVKMPDELTVDFMLNKVLCHPITFIKKRLFIDYGLYNESLTIIGDWAFFLKVIVTGNATWLHRDISVTMFSMDGISSHSHNQEIIKKERKAVIDYTFSKALKDYFLHTDDLELKIGQLTEENRSLKDENQRLRRYQFFRRTKRWAGNKKRKIRPALKKLKSKFIIFLQLVNSKRIPIIINSYNRLSCLKELISFLEKNGYKNIFILDNQSTYQPLLDFYKETKYKVIFLGKNFGHLALWESGLDRSFSDAFFVYTDPDIIPCEDCPSDFMKRFLRILYRFPAYKKVGFGLRINDIPNDYPFKDKVLKWERQFWEKPIGNEIYSAQIDTTFALHAPGFTYSGGLEFYDAIRTGGNYQARHLSWYILPEVATDEDLFYKETASQSASWTLQSNPNY
jgi:glycosyltransferase involved in cell wall biosynthesis